MHILQDTLAVVWTGALIVLCWWLIQLGRSVKVFMFARLDAQLLPQEDSKPVKFSDRRVEITRISGILTRLSAALQRREPRNLFKSQVHVARDDEFREILLSKPDCLLLKDAGSPTRRYHPRHFVSGYVPAEVVAVLNRRLTELELPTI